MYINQTDATVWWLPFIEQTEYKKQHTRKKSVPLHFIRYLVCIHAITNASDDLTSVTNENTFHEGARWEKQNNRRDKRRRQFFFASISIW